MFIWYRPGFTVCNLYVDDEEEYITYHTGIVQVPYRSIIKIFPK